MAISDDILVVGGGLAGTTAALAAAQEGARVRLVTYKKNTLRQASGLIDVLGYADGEGPLANPFGAIDDLPTDHPYGATGVEAVREALGLFDEAAGDLYRGSHTEANALVPTHGGAVKPTARYPRAAAAGLASDERDALFVGFEAHADFDAPVAAAHLAAAGVPFETRGVTIPFPRSFRADAKLTRYARALDRDEAVDGRGTREALAAAVRPHLKSKSKSKGFTAERVGFPALLGDAAHDDVREELESRLNAAVFEVPMGPPSLPGLRLESRLEAALDDAGVRIDSGVPAVGYEADDDGGTQRLTATLVDRNGRRVPYHAEQFVLATGGLVGKGIDSDREGVREPIFGCRVPHPDDRYNWFDDAAFGDHAFARFGLRTDGSLRPLDATGRPEFSNLRAAGAVLGGADVAAEKSAGGISLATGLVAGRDAAHHTSP